MSSQRVLILRHGESEWNVERRWQGWLDAPLTGTGQAQAEEDRGGTGRHRQPGGCGRRQAGRRCQADYAYDLEA